MDNLYNENGLSEYGEAWVKQFFDKEVKMLLQRAKSRNEAHIIGSLLQARVGELVSNCCNELK